MDVDVDVDSIRTTGLVEGKVSKTPCHVGLLDSDGLNGFDFAVTGDVACTEAFEGSETAATRSATPTPLQTRSSLHQYTLTVDNQDRSQPSCALSFPILLSFSTRQRYTSGLRSSSTSVNSSWFFFFFSSVSFKKKTNKQKSAFLCHPPQQPKMKKKKKSLYLRKKKKLV